MPEAAGGLRELDEGGARLPHGSGNNSKWPAAVGCVDGAGGLGGDVADVVADCLETRHHGFYHFIYL